MASEAVRAWAINRGFVMAKHVFTKRGSHSEVHIGLEELSLLMTAALEIGAEKGIEAATRVPPSTKGTTE
jgi:hypothetical protein